MKIMSSYTEVSSVSGSYTEISETGDASNTEQASIVMENFLLAQNGDFLVFQNGDLINIGGTNYYVPAWT
jgi:hypothetical protein